MMMRHHPALAASPRPPSCSHSSTGSRKPCSSSTILVDLAAYLAAPLAVSSSNPTRLKPPVPPGRT